VFAVSRLLTRTGWLLLRPEPKEGERGWRRASWLLALGGLYAVIYLSGSSFSDSPPKPSRFWP